MNIFSTNVEIFMFCVGESVEKERSKELSQK